jgi:hypothetical protein
MPDATPLTRARALLAAWRAELHCSNVVYGVPAVVYGDPDIARDIAELDEVIGELSQLEQQAARSEAPAAELKLRRMLCLALCCGTAYMDDGEASDCSRSPFIDFLRDPVADIEEKLRRRNAAASPPSAQPAEKGKPK